MKLRYYKRSAVISVSCNESQVSEANNLKVTIGVLKLAGRIIPRAKLSGTISKSCFSFHTRDLLELFVFSLSKRAYALMTS
jgi:hypothetical protein